MLCFLLSLSIIRLYFLFLRSFYLCHFGCIPKSPASLCFSLFFSFSLSSLSVIIYSICPLHLSLSFSPSLSVWAPAQILLMLLHTGLGPNQQGDKSIQRENYVMCHHIDWPSLLLHPPWVVSSSAPCSLSLTHLVLLPFVCLLPSFNKNNCQSLI